MNLLSDKVGTLYRKYLIPAVGGTLVSAVYILGDTIMIGKGVVHEVYGSIGMNALTLVSPIVSLLFATGYLFGVGGAVLFNVGIGNGDKKRAQSVFTVSLISVAAITLLLTLLLNLIKSPLINFLGATPEMAPYVDDYLKWILYTAPVFIFSTYLQALVRADKNPKLSMVAVLTGGVLNLVLDYIFIFPMDMGMAGGAIATCISNGVTIVLLLMHFVRKNNNLRVVRPQKFFNKAFAVAKNGFASFLVDFANGILVFMFNIQVLKYLGAEAHVVYGVIMNMAILFMALFNGVGQAVQPIVAANYGAGQGDRVKKVFMYGLITALILGVLAVLTGEIYPEGLVGLFADRTSGTDTISRTAIRLYFISFAFMPFNLYFCAYFQGVLRSGSAIVVSLLRGALLSGTLLFTLPLVMPGITLWLVMPITEFVTLAVAVLLFNKRKEMVRS